MPIVDSIQTKVTFYCSKVHSSFFILPKSEVFQIFMESMSFHARTVTKFLNNCRSMPITLLKSGKLNHQNYLTLFLIRVTVK